MRHISHGLAATLTLMACSSSPPLAPSQTVSPSPNLRLTASLSQSSLNPGATVQLSVQLKNEGTSQTLIQGAGRCNPALQVFITDSSDRIIWAQPLPLCAEPSQPQGPLAPGDQVSDSQCFTLAADTGSSPAQCARLDLPSGTVFVGGSFHGMNLPRLALTLARS